MTDTPDEWDGTPPPPSHPILDPADAAAKAALDEWAAAHEGPIPPPPLAADSPLYQAMRQKWEDEKRRPPTEYRDPVWSPSPQFSHGGWQPAPTSPPGHGLGTAALVCGIVGCVVGLVPLGFLAAWALGLVALVLGLVSWRRGKRAGVRQGRAGAILGAVAFLLGCVGYVVVSNAFSDLDRDLNTIEEPTP